MTNKLKYFIGNWKMFGDFTSFKIVSKLNEFKYRSKDVYKTKIVLCVPNTLIYFFKKNLKSKHLSLGAQNCNEYEKEGPYTGSVSSAMIKKAGAEYIILGHSENRSEGETNRLCGGSTGCTDDTPVVSRWLPMLPRDHPSCSEEAF